jgi:SH3-like domain-containing protein
MDRLRLLAALLLIATAGSALAQTGLPVPRFVTLRADEVNVRTGPGSRYPVEWVFARKGMPVEVVAEFDTWRRIRDIDGIEGWVHQSLLQGRRGLIVTGSSGTQPVRIEPSDDAAMAAEAEAGVIGRLLACPGPGEEGAGWCWVDLSGTRGWMHRDAIWGIYPTEVIE